MVDPRTKEYFRELLQKTVETAEEICQCASCTAERKALRSPPKKDIGATQKCDTPKITGNPSNFYPELSPDYEFIMSSKKYKYG